METNAELVKYLIKQEILRTPSIIEAFVTTDRMHFIPHKFSNEAYLDYPLPIGDGQTIYQPTTAAIILELLQAKEGDFVLEIGSNSGWLTALLAKIVGSEGYIYTYEINKVIGESGKRNLAKLEKDNYSFKIGEPRKYWYDNAPYNRILSRYILDDDEEEELLDILTPNGVMVFPTKDKDMVKISKDKNGNTTRRIYSSYVYVPLQ